MNEAFDFFPPCDRNRKMQLIISKWLIVYAVCVLHRLAVLFAFFVAVIFIAYKYKLFCSIHLHFEFVVRKDLFILSLCSYFFNLKQF